MEAVSEDDSQEERERKERIPQRKADISRCWSKYCLDVLRTSRDQCVQELTNADQNDEEQKTEKGWESCFYYSNLEFNSLNLKVQGKFLMVNKPCEVIINQELSFVAGSESCFVSFSIVSASRNPFDTTSSELFTLVM